jgi:hypothetical protein
MFSKRYFVCALLLAAFLLALAQAEPLRAQVPGILGMPKLYAEFKTPEVGTWVKYQLLDGKNQTESILRLSIVGEEKIKGEGDFLWYEIEQSTLKTGDVYVIKMLISGNPQEPGVVKRMIYKSGKDPANELPQAFVSLMNQRPEEKAKAAEHKPKELGTEKIKTKMKTFSCVHTQDSPEGKSVTDTWTSDEVPLFGIVRSTSGTKTLELLEHGKGAVTAIKETPKLLEMPGQK